MIPRKLTEADGLKETREAVNDLIDWARDIERETYPLDIRDITDMLPTHETKEYKQRAEDDIQQIVIHHVGVDAVVGPQQVAVYHVNKKGWPGIAYHYFIRTQGEVYQCQYRDVVSYHCAGHCNTISLGICLEGSFVDGRRPTPEQKAALRALNNHLLATLGPNIQIVGHKEVRQTRCPGDDWKAWKEEVVP